MDSRGRFLVSGNKIRHRLDNTWNKCGSSTDFCDQWTNGAGNYDVNTAQWMALSYGLDDSELLG